MELKMRLLKKDVYHVIRAKKNWKRALLPWIMLAPSIILLTLVISAPLIVVVGLSFTKWNGIGNPTFIGLENYIRLFNDQIYLSALINNLEWMIFFLTFPIVIGLTLALLISKVKWAQLFYRTVIFTPYILSTIVTAQIWRGLYNPYIGINTKFEEWGLGFLTLSWLGNPDIALYAVAFTDAWHFWGFLVVMFMVALQQLDKGLEEAAKVEGANKLRIFWHVILPQLRPTIVLIYMLLIIWSFAAFDYVFVMTQGGPGNATELIATYMYKKALFTYEMGYASTIGVTMGIFSIMVIIGFGYLKKKGWDV